MHDNASADHNEVELRRIVEENARKETWCVRALVLLLVFEAVVFWRYAGDKPWYETLAFILCDLGVAAAVGGEVIFEARRSTAQSELQLISDEKVAASIAQAAEADKRAAEANQKAEEANLALAMYWRPRQLSVDEINRIAEKLRPYAGVKYVGGVSFSHPEFINLLEHIEEALEDAGWIEINCPNPRRIEREGKPSICDAAPALRPRQ